VKNLGRSEREPVPLPEFAKKLLPKRNQTKPTGIQSNMAVKRALYESKVTQLPKKGRLSSTLKD